MERAELLHFMRTHAYAVQASVSPSGAPQAAVVGIVVSDGFEIFFDTLASTRKAQNLRADSRIAFVIGGSTEEEQTLQFEGMVDVPSGAELQTLQQRYFARFPEGKDRQHWPGIAYLRAKPTWIRYSDYYPMPAQIIEFTAEQLKNLK